MESMLDRREAMRDTGSSASRRRVAAREIARQSARSWHDRDLMKGRRKHRRWKLSRAQREQPITARSGRLRARPVLLLGGLVVAAAGSVVLVILLFWPLSPPSHPVPQAAIVDELALTDPNSAFVQHATDLLQASGYKVDYYPSETVTVNAYRNLPAHNYGVILLRTHTAMHYIPGDPTKPLNVTGDVDLFTTELYSTTTYVSEQLARQVDPAELLSNRRVQYFSVGPQFVAASMKGHFRNTTIILMGCDGLMTRSMADALIRRGAGSVISWDKSVTPSHTDAATGRLLEHLLVDHNDAKQAVAQTMLDVGPDRDFGAPLAPYP